MENVAKISFFEAIAEAREAKAAYQQLNDLVKKFKDGIGAWGIEEMEKAIPFWYQICNVITVYKNWNDIELEDLFKELKNHVINRNQLKERMKPQTDQVEAELKERKKRYEKSMRTASTAYSNWVKSIPSTHKYLAFVLRQPEIKKYIIEELLKF